MYFLINLNYANYEQIISAYFHGLDSVNQMLNFWNLNFN